MKLLFCIKSMNCAGGGAERVLAEVASGLAERGHEVAVLSFDRPVGRSFYPMHHSIQRIEIGLGPTTEPSGLLDTLTRIIVMRAKILDFLPDVVIGFMHSSFIPLSLSMLGKKIKLIASEHIVYEHYKNLPLQRCLLLLTAHLIPVFTCTSEQALLTYPYSVRRKMVVISNPVSIGVNARANTVGCGLSRKTLLSVGRLEDQKDHSVLIRAFSKIAEELPDWDLRIVGGGSLRAQLAAQAKALRLENRIQLPGPTTDISKEYLTAQIFVVSSRYESFGLATAEALAHGLPVVGFADCPGTNELVRCGRNGLLASGGLDRAESMANALRVLMTDDQLRISLSSCSKDTLETFQLGPVVDRWEQLMEKTVTA
jgi:glycosyltransferase involved in cell wall biosynthesis